MTSERKWSEQQTKIFEWFNKGQGNLVVRARAGTGKTTTILEGIGHAPEQKILLAAFNKRIAEELTQKLRNPCADAKTLHSIGFGFVMRNWSNVRLDDERGERNARKAMGPKAPDPMVRLVTRLASKAKGMCPFPTTENLIDIAYEFDLDPDEQWEEDGWTVEAIANYANAAMANACQKDGTLDFDDMIYVPLANKWVKGRWDLVVIDEAQDMNASQIMMAMGVCKPGGRVAVVGDDRQAIYGFRGADSGSIDRLKKELKACELGLTITYRCPKLIVDLARTQVADFYSAPEAIDGKISTVPYEKFGPLAQIGDFVLSRKNAPLAKVCLSLLKSGKRAKIEGKDIGRGLVSIIKKLNAKSMPDFLTKLSRWEDKQVARLEATKKKSAEAKMEVVHDQADTLRSLSEGLSGVRELETRITELFADKGDGNASYVVCSSVHRAKGLEADRVFILKDTLYPNYGKKAPVGGSTEEHNIFYVAVTRAKKELTWVVGIG